LGKVTNNVKWQWLGNSVVVVITATSHWRFNKSKSTQYSDLHCLMESSQDPGMGSPRPKEFQ
jgi:hypothetical protein